ncbi:MAG: TonB family protein, partial [Kofleriaceae bacterium]|nr:TonB family protein [Kofleriaceae bacterium]
EPAPEPAAPAPTVAAPAVVTPTPAPAPPPAAPPDEPKEPEVTVATLSNATVSAVAADNAASLSKCKVDDLSGNVSVSFQIDGNGKVVKSQLASTAKSPKIAACILKAVQSWKFPRPPSGAAKGVYTISYQ